jgi:hypothetical protein
VRCHPRQCSHRYARSVDALCRPADRAAATSADASSRWRTLCEHGGGAVMRLEFLALPRRNGAKRREILDECAALRVDSSGEIAESV